MFKALSPDSVPHAPVDQPSVHRGHAVLVSPIALLGGGPGQTGATEGVGAAQSTYGVTGAGLTIGIISDSFNLTDPTGYGNPSGDNMAADIAAGLLPATILKDGVTGQGDMDEGRAIGQLIHAIAPGAALDFQTAGQSQQDMADAILALAKAGCKIIVDDVIFPDEPAYQDGIIATTIDQVVAQYGVTYVSAAGNSNHNGWQGAANFIALPQSVIGSNGLAYIDPNAGASNLHFQSYGGTLNNYLPLTAVYNADYLKYGLPTDVQVVLQWNQPRSGQASAGPTSQLDLLIEDLTTGRLLPAVDQGTTTVSSSGEAVQLIDFTPIAGHDHYALYIADANYASVAPPTDLKVVVFSDDYVDLNGAATTYQAAPTPTDYGHAAAAGAISIGAAPYLPVPGSAFPAAESFSSTGPDVQYFDAQGRPLATPFAAHGPDIAAADGGDTSFFPEYPVISDTDGNGHPNFFGTSAAAGDAAGIAALVLQADPALTDAQVRSVLQHTATPSASPSQLGAGLIQADKAVGLAEHVVQSGLSPVFAPYAGGVAQATGPGEILIGSAANDTFVAGGGREVIEGGGGLDTARFAGASTGYAITTGLLASGTVTGGAEAVSASFSAVQDVVFADGTLTFDGGSAADQVFRLYEAAFGRRPDPLGYDFWTHQLQNGETLQGFTAATFNSTEFQADTSALNTDEYVRYLYQTVQHRAPDPGGESNYVTQLNEAFVTRAQVLQAFSESPENQANTGAVTGLGLWVETPAAAEVSRLYDAALERLPDPGGLAFYAHALQGGLSLHDLATDLLGSTEFLAKSGGLDDKGFVDLLYQTTLRRAPDGGGEAFYVAALQHGLSHADLLADFSESLEHQAYVQPLIDHGIVFTG